MKLFQVCCLAVVLGAAAHPLIGQTISGTVVDTNDAPIVGAEVQVIADGSTISRAVTDSAGKFSIGQAPSISKLRITAEGFLPLETDGLTAAIFRLRPAALKADVIISITRSESRLSQTPASVVVLDRDSLETAAAQSIDDVLRQVAGFSLFRRSSSRATNPTAQGANLRGLSGSGAGRASVLFDGMSMNDAFGGWTYWSRVPMIAVEQVEVLRGGASTFYGSSGLSGAIDLKPRSDRNSTLRFQTSAGSQGTYEGSVLARASKRGWSIGVTGEVFRTSGYVPIAAEERGLVDTPANSRHANGLFTLEKRFLENGRVFARGNIFRERRDNGTSLTRNDTYFRHVTVGGDISFAGVGAFQLRSFIETQVYDQTFSAVSGDRNAETLTRIQRVPSQTSGVALRWQEAFGRHAVTASVEENDVRGVSDETGFSSGRATAVSGSGGRQRTYSFFAQDTFDLSSKLTLSIGARIDAWKNFDAASVTQTLSTGQTTVVSFLDRKENAFSPRLGMIYNLGRGVSMYGAYSRSFRAPTLNELYRGFRVGNVVTLPNEDLRSEIADSFEGGASFRGYNGRLNVRGNLFTTTVSDPVVSVTLSSTPSLITRKRENVGETRTTGVELDIDLLLRSDLRLTAGYLFADARIANYPPNAGLEGRFLPQVPRHQANFQIAFSPRNRFSAAVQVRGSGAQFEDDVNSLRLRPYFAADAFVGYRLKRGVQLFGASENIFNSRYDIGLTPSRTIAAPTLARVGLRFDLTKK